MAGHGGTSRELIDIYRSGVWVLCEPIDDVTLIAQVESVDVDGFHFAVERGELLCDLLCEALAGRVVVGPDRHALVR